MNEIFSSSIDLISQMRAGLGMIDHDNRIFYVNTALEKYLGYPSAEMLQHSILDFVKTDQQFFLEGKLNYQKDNNDFFMPVTLLKKNGHKVDAIITFSKVISENGVYQSAVFHVIDIDQNRFYHAIVDGHNVQNWRALSGLNKIMAEIALTGDLKKLLNLVFFSLQSYTGFDGGGFFIYKSEIPTIYAFERSEFIELPLSLVNRLQKFFKNHPSFLERDLFILSKMAVTSEHFSVHQELFNLISPGTEPPDAIKTFSLESTPRSNGAFFFYHPSENGFRAEMLGIADILTTHALIAIENMYLMRNLENLATENERIRLSRELHDSVAQGLYSLMLYGEASRRALVAKKIKVVEENLEEMILVSREAMSDLRLLIFELRPPMIEDIGFAGAIMSRLESVEKRSGTHAECHVYGDSSLNPEVEKELYWVVHEALNNVLKHAKAADVIVDIHLSNQSTIIIIKDNGIGFSTEDTISFSGVGLRSMAERIEKLGGQLKVTSELGQGTTIEIRIYNNKAQVLFIPSY